jgi:ABC-type Zn uptake system ZnuABC Zn-binding protein ZnuA
MTNSRLFLRLTLVLLAAAVFQGCSRRESTVAGSEKIEVIASTTMIGDMVRQIAGDHVRLTTILKPGQDPHIYKPVPSDPRRVSEADLILLNGLRLEEYIEEMVRSAAAGKPVIYVSTGIEPIMSEGTHAAPDPHIWFDVNNAIQMARNVMEALIQHDPNNAAVYRENGERYLKELSDLDQWVFEQTRQIPEPRRKIVTSHDAFSYFGKRYGFEVLAVQGISTDAAAQAKDVAMLIEQIRQQNVPAVFVETSVNPKMLEQVANEANVQIAGKLYSDSLGDPESAAGTYTGMIKENVQTIVNALK